MIPVTMGGLSAVSLGVADFIASQNSERIGAARALGGMLLVSSLLLSILMLIQGGFDGLFVATNIWLTLLASLHGATMAIALLLFFHAMTIGKISVVAPIVAAHPVVIVTFHASQGTHFSAIQMASVVGILLGVALVGTSGSSHTPGDQLNKHYAKWQTVVLTSLAASLIYGIAILFLQSAAAGLVDLQVLWFGRCFGFLTVLTILLVSKQTPIPPSTKWWGLFLLHGMLDTGGLLFLLLGTEGGVGNSITAVVASTFPVITMGLAWVILKEHVRPLQFLGAVFVFTGVSMIVTY